ncbi:MAG: SIS domain-containing protein [Saprospiraceae bacterium]|nr:SIS domain-containing protein [Saprospiraceae bacterium]
MFQYTQIVLQQLEKVISTQVSALTQAAEWMADCIAEDRIIHTFGTGHSHMIGLELFTRAGGLANVNAMLDSTVLSVEGARRGAAVERVPGLAQVVWDTYEIASDDLMIVISNSGRNAMPIEMATLAKANGMKTIGITSLTQSKAYPSRHPSGKKLYEIVDLVIDNGVPSGDVTMDIAGYRTGPFSTVSGVVLMNTMMTEACKMAAEKGVKLPLYHSQNIDGYSNEELYQKFEDRIKHL